MRGAGAFLPSKQEVKFEILKPRQFIVSFIESIISLVVRMVTGSINKPPSVDLSTSSALRMDKSKLPCLSAEESATLREESQ